MPGRVLLLFGGGLDSRLARATLERAGQQVVPVHFDTGFVHAARRRAVDAEGIERVDVARDYLREVVLAPRHGHGAGLNACRDCRRFLLARADGVARARGIDRLATGDVVGQRALDQSRAALARADHEAAVEGRVVRPLSAEPLSLHGQGRRAQLELAGRLGLVAAPSTGGGCCLLADRRFARRLRDLVEHRDPATIDRPDLELLRVGRHYRLDWAGKLVVGRDEAECRWLAARAGDDWVCRAASGRGAIGLLDAEPDGERGTRAAGIVAGHGPARGDSVVPVEMRRGFEVRRFEARPAVAAELRARRL